MQVERPPPRRPAANDDVEILRRGRAADCDETLLVARPDRFVAQPLQREAIAILLDPGDRFRPRRRGDNRQISQGTRNLEGVRPLQVSPLLTRKKVKPHGLRTTARDYDLICSDGEKTLHVPTGALVIPLRDFGGEIHSLEFIWADGKKRFLPGGQKLGHFYVLGDPAASKAPCIAEGFATGASIFEVTGNATIIAADCGNLGPVAEVFRREFPKKTIIVCADDDIGVEGNPGLKHATKAAQAIGGLLAVPDFGPERPEGTTAFNDLRKLRRANAVKRCIRAASAPTDAPENAQASACAADGQTHPHPRTGGRFRVDGSGTWYDPPDGSAVPPTWLASQIRLLAASRDNLGSEWGTLIEVLNADGGAHAWAMPRELLAERLHRAIKTAKARLEAYNDNDQ